MKDKIRRLFGTALAITLIAGMITGCEKSPAESSSSHSSSLSADSDITTSSLIHEQSEAVSSMLQSSSAAQASSKANSSKPNHQTAASSKTSTIVQPASSTPNEPEKEDDVTIDNSKIRKLGRVVAQDNGSAIVDWSSSGIEYVINGTGSIVTMRGSTAQEDNLPYINVYVDGNKRKTIKVTNEKKRYNVCSGLEEGRHVIRLVKISEAVFSNVVISRVEIQGTLEEPEQPRKRKLEFIGDSITSGWGMLVGGNTPFSTATEDSTRTWAALTADALDAEYNMFSISGEGIAVSGQSIPPKYEKANPCSDIKTMWNFDTYQPDAVIVNLGTNDMAQGVDRSKFQAESVSFLKQLRKCNPNAEILWVYGVMNDGYSSDIQSAVAAYQQETGDQKVSFFQLERQGFEVGGQGHPNLETHQKMADAVTPILKEKLGW